eukprot:365810-Chlamydomonas_euryale.AAC.4
MKRAEKLLQLFGRKDGYWSARSPAIGGWSARQSPSKLAAVGPFSEYLANRGTTPPDQRGVGGRTEQHHAERVFTKEREDGEKRVLSVMARGTRGFAFVDALDKRDVPPSLPGHESVEAVAACMETVYGEVHDNLFALLAGPEYTNEELAAGPLPARLRISEDGLAAARTTSALLSEAVSQLLQLLRVFSFS